jgi:GxxExxY protein
MIHEELSEEIIGSAMAALNELKPGLDEKLYENALVIEMTKHGHRIAQRMQFPVHFDGELIGKLIPDLIIEDKVVVDTKVVTGFTETHMAQMMGYLAISDLRLAILLNFKNTKLEWKRVVR